MDFPVVVVFDFEFCVELFFVFLLGGSSFSFRLELTEVFGGDFLFAIDGEGCFLIPKTTGFLFFLGDGNPVMLRFRFRLFEAVLLAILAVSTAELHSELESYCGGGVGDLAFLTIDEEDVLTASCSTDGSILVNLAFLAAFSAALVSGVVKSLLKIVDCALSELTRLFSLFLLSMRLVSAIVEVMGGI